MEKKSIKIKGRLVVKPVSVSLNGNTVVYILLNVDSHLPPHHSTCLKMYAILPKDANDVVESFYSSLLLSQEKNLVVVTAYTDEHGCVEPEILGFKNIDLYL